MALIGLTIAGLGVSYLPKEAVGQMLDEGSLALIKVTPALPPVTYVAWAIVWASVILGSAIFSFSRREL